MEQNLYKEKKYEVRLSPNELAELYELITEYSKHEINEIAIFHEKQICKLEVIADELQQQLLKAKKFRSDLFDKFIESHIPTEYISDNFEIGKYQFIIQIPVMLNLNQILTVLYYTNLFKTMDFNLDCKKVTIRSDIDSIINRINRCIEDRVAPKIALEE